MNKQELKIEKLQEAIQEEWGNLHHNASIRFPDIQNDYESELFWDCLGDNNHWALDDLKDEIKEKFGFDWHFYSYGRSGATIAPNEPMAAAACDGFGGLKDDYYYEEDEEELQNLLDALTLINKRTKEYCRAVPEWWADMKEANEYQKDIDAHDGKHKIMVGKWVD